MSFGISRAHISRCRVVYFGAPGAGKATSIQHVYKSINPLRKSELRFKHRGVDQILELSFDVKIRNTVARVSLGAITGSVQDPQSLVSLLEGVQGIVVVADSSPSSFGANLRALQLLDQALGVQGRRLDAIPHVLQYNKRDLPDALPIAELDDALNRYGVPSYATVATEGLEIEKALVAAAASVLDTTEAALAREDGGRSRGERLAIPELTPLEVAERRNIKRSIQTKRKRSEVDKSLEMAEHFLAQADYGECLRWARRALQKDPNHARAKDLFESTKAKIDELVEQLYEDATAARDRGDIGGASERAEHALELHPHHRGFELLLTELKVLSRPALNPAPAYSSSPPPRPAETGEDPKVTERKTEVVSLIRESENLLKSGDHRAALALLARIEERAPLVSSDPRQLLAAIDQRRGKAFAELRKRGRALLEAGEPDRAHEVLSLLLEHDPDNAQALALMDRVGTAMIAQKRAAPARPKTEAEAPDWDLAALLEGPDPRPGRRG